MSDTFAAREFIVDFLRRELVGPSPGYPAVQISRQEILRAQDPPRMRYGAGILFPMRSQVLGQDETAGDEEPPQEADSPHPDQIVEGSELDRSADTQISAGDNPPDTDRDVTLANEYLPSAMGISALLEVPDRLCVEVSAGVYRNEVLEWAARTDRDGGTSYPKAWWRQPIERSIQLSSGDLLGMGTIAFERSVFDQDGRPALSLHVVSRPHGDPAVSNRSRLVTFTLVNRRSSDSRTPHNSDCFFQCGFSIQDASGQACFLSYPDQPRDARDSEELSLQLLYLHRRTFAVGHGCAPEWSGTYEGRTTTIRTEVLPTSEVKPVLPTEVEGLDLRMIELMSDDRDTCTKLCTRLADEYEAWIIEREEEIETRVDLTPELRETSRRHMENCRECLRRMRDGVTLLGRDEVSANAFRMMNEAMFLQSVHYTISSEHSRKWKKVKNRLELEVRFARPNYEDARWDRQWRPFQLAFILMNLNGIADPYCTDRKLVDVIWFPTGGGKT